MEKSHDQWEQDGSYAARLKVVNDTAERGIARIQKIQPNIDKGRNTKAATDSYCSRTSETNPTTHNIGNYVIMWL